MNKDLLKIYIPQLLPNLDYVEILNPNLGFKKRRNIFGDKDVFDDFKEPVFDLVTDITRSDFILIPHNYFLVKDNKEYLEEIAALSRSSSKKILLFAIGDSYESIDMPNIIILRMSQYGTLKRKNEIIIPAYAADLSYDTHPVYRNKGILPIVGFCGWARVLRMKDRMAIFLKNLFLFGPKRLGLYFRRKALLVLSNSPLVRTNFIIRNSYGASWKTIGLDPKQARKEYRDNMMESDFILAPKGDGNYSVRFYEALSLGRVPILIDTDCPLPLYKDIDYSKFILKVSYKDIDRLDSIVSDFYGKISDEDWINIQKSARYVFEHFLKIDAFFRHIFTRENINKYIS